MAEFNEERRLSRAFDSWGLVTIVEARNDCEEAERRASRGSGALVGTGGNPITRRLVSGQPSCQEIRPFVS